MLMRAPNGYRLKSDLARVCLPAPHAHDQRNLAWTNSICLLFLIIGLAGLQAAPPPPIPVKPLEEPAPVLIEQEQPPPQVTESKADEQDVQKPDASPPRVVVVIPESPGMPVSVPTTNGVLVAPKEYAVTPEPGLRRPPRRRARSQPSSAAGWKPPAGRRPHRALLIPKWRRTWACRDRSNCY